MVQAVLRQTGGHPYLTLRLCEEFCKQRGASPNEVDRLVEKSFSNLEAVRSDVHFEQIQRFLGERVEDRLATLALYRRILPDMSQTEREAIDAGTVWWDADLFSGRPDWDKLLAVRAPRLSPEEQAFLDGPVEELCAMCDDWQITHELQDLPPHVWQYIKDKGFLGMIIPKKYGGLEFSALAHSAVVMKLSTRSGTAAISVMVPNSLGPAQLLLHYGTDEQKDYYLPRLAKAFFLTGDERYAREAVAQIETWIAQNPRWGTVNWQSSLELAIRSISWMWTIFLLLPAESLDEGTLRRICRSLFAQLDHVYRYPSVYTSPNTHLTGEAGALFIGGLLFQGFPRAEVWHRFSSAVLVREMQRQFSSEGVYGEASSYYHCYATDFYLQVLALDRSNGSRFPEWMWRRLAQAIEYVMHLTRPDVRSCSVWSRRFQVSMRRVS